MKTMIRLLLVDDHRLMLSGLQSLLDEEEDLEVVATATSGEEALRLMRGLKPHVVLMDINMPGMGGLEATRRLSKRYRDVKVIAVSMYGDEPYPSRLMEAGASGYLSKGSTGEEIVTAIRRVARGESFVAPGIANRLAVSLLKGNGGSPFDRLSQREMQVALLISRGKSTRTISDTLCLSPKTVSTYRYRIFEKFEIHNDVELTRLTMRYGLVGE